MKDAIDTETLRAAFVQAQAQIMNNGKYTPVVVRALIDSLRRPVENDHAE